MQLHADLSQPARVQTHELDWVSSPVPGVERRMIERDGDEIARATSLVRYAPDTKFATHRHDMGEEFLVLDGIFSDEHGDFPAGTYVRNPPGTAHAPHCDDGCTIFVKLRQFDPEDLEPVCIDTRTARWSVSAPGIETLPLHRFRTETVQLVRLSPGASVKLDGVAELLVLEGQLDREGEAQSEGTWLRIPRGERLTVTSPTGALLWQKTGHLR